MNLLKIILIITIFIFTLITPFVYAQIDPTAHIPAVAYSTRLIVPQIYRVNPYGIENLNTVIQTGVFDNIQISQTTGFAETHIIVSPANPLNFVATDNRITGYAGPIYVFYTTNGGVDPWLETTSGLSGNQGDPVFAADGLGNFYLSVLNSGPEFFKSTNEGANWTGPTLVVSNSNADKEWIAADPTGTGTYHNNVYLAYDNFNTSSVDFWRSTNNGAIWAMTTNIGWGVPSPGPNVQVGPDGTVYCAWYNGSGAEIKVSSDGGATFGSGILAASYLPPGMVCYQYYVKQGIRVFGFPMMKVDQNNGNVYIAYCMHPPVPWIADIYFVRSTNHGASFSAPIRVTDDSTSKPNDHWMTDCSFDNAGRVWVYWWDSREDNGNNVTTRSYAAVSTDGGQTFSANFPIGNQNFNPNAIKILQQVCGTLNTSYLGDYQGMAGTTMTFPCWVGNGNSLQDFVCYLPDYGIGFLKSPDYVSPGGTETNHVEFPVNGPYSGTLNLTSSITPAPSQGTLTVSFPSGNTKTLSGHADSTNIQVVASSNCSTGNYQVNVTAAETGGPRTHTRYYTLAVVTGIQNNNHIANEFYLGQNYPNPFNPSTEINYSIPARSIVSLKVYDILGREVAVLINNEYKNAGNYTEKFNASNLPSGIYFYKIVAGGYSDVKTMSLIK